MIDGYWLPSYTHWNNNGRISVDTWNTNYENHSHLHNAFKHSRSVHFDIQPNDEKKNDALYFVYLSVSFFSFKHNNKQTKKN